MTEITNPDAWPTLFKTFQRLMQTMEDRIKAAGLPPIEIYDVLWTLEQAPNHTLRFNELGEKVYLARFNVTRLCDKLEGQGLITKFKCTKDKRGVYASLTPEGLRLRKKIWAFYKKLIDELFSSKLTLEDHKNLIKTMKKVALHED